MSHFIVGVSLIMLFFILMFSLIAIGHRVGLKMPATTGSLTEGAVFTLMGLLIAFTFSSAVQRFDQRRVMIIDETNTIGTAYLRLDLLLPSDASLLKNDFLAFINSRLAIYNAIPDMEAVGIELKKSTDIQAKLWLDAVNACKNSNSQAATMLLLPAINAMFDIASSRNAYSYLHTHYLIFTYLIIVAFLSAFLAGYGSAKKGSWRSLHIIAYALVTTLTIYIIFDLEVPRLGFIKEVGFDSLLVDLRNSMVNPTKPT